jgi:hypothetical protein
MQSKTKPALLFLLAAFAIVLAGCWHRKTDQQKFIEAMNHGNSAQASQIWLNMDAKNRADFSHSQGMQPNVSSDEVKKQLTQHYLDKVEDSDQTVEHPTPNVHLGGLDSLPEWVGPSGAPPQAVTVPSKDTPPN